MCGERSWNFITRISGLIPFSVNSPITRKYDPDKKNINKENAAKYQVVLLIHKPSTGLGHPWCTVDILVTTATPVPSSICKELETESTWMNEIRS
jgi:hypothetical protein